MARNNEASYYAQKSLQMVSKGFIGRTVTIDEIYAAGEKYTVQQLKAYADQVALSDNVLNFIYARCSKILKDKVDQANEVAKALSKILSSLIQEMQTFNYTSKHM